MNQTMERGTLLPVRDGYVLCPHCLPNRLRVKLIQVQPETQARHLRLFCRNCKTEYSVNIEKGQCFESRCQ